jgi:hypothetical protein
MDIALLIPIAGIVAGAWMFIAALNFMRDRQALRLQADGGDREKAELAEENSRLKATVERMEERLAVLERIATDPAERTAREIESLR